MKKILRKKTLILIGYAVVSYLVNVAAFAMGDAFIAESGIMAPLLIIGIMIAVCAISYARFFRLSRKFKDSNLERVQSRILKERSEALANYEEYQKKLARNLFIEKLYLAVYPLLALALSFAAGALSEKRAGVSLILLLLASYITWGFLLWNHKTTASDPDEELVLSRDEYPAFYKLLDACFPDEKKQPYFMIGQRDNIGVARVNGRICVMLGVYQAAVLTSSELYAVLLHEKSHLIQDLKDPRSEIVALLNRHDLPSEYGFFAMLVDYMLLGNLGILEILADYSDIIVNEEKERLADVYSMENGDAACASSALFKSKMIELYFSFEDRARLCYTGETASKHLMRDNLKDFLQALPERKDFWLNLIMKELPPRMDSHPIVRKRWESMGAPDFKIEIPVIFTEAEKSPYEADQLHFIDAYDKLQTRANEEDYEELHKEYYTEPMATLERYEADQQKQKVYTALEMRPVLDACSKLEKKELLKELCLKTISISDNDHDACHANFLLGNLLIRQYDTEGISYLYKAAETNSNYMEEAMDLIGDFLLLMNMSDEMEVYREKALAMQQESIDNQFEETGRLSKRDKLSEENTLPDSQIKANIEFIVKVCGSSLSSLYQVRKQITDDFACTFYIPCFAPETSKEDVNRCMDQIFEYLDSLPDQYSLMSVDELTDIKADQLPGKIDLRRFNTE